MSRPPLPAPRPYAPAARATLALAFAALSSLAFAQAASPGVASVASAPVIVEVATGRALAPGELASRLAPVRYRLLGEVHDNAAHHDARAGLIRDIAATGVRPAVALEVFDLDRDESLRAAQSDGRADADALAQAGGLERKAWRWPLHRPPVEAALAAGLPVRAANLSRPALQRAMRAGTDAGADAPWAGLLRETRWSSAQQATLESSIVEGHCGKLPPAAAARIARAQRERDAAMAQATIDAATRDGTILLAGNGHVRRDVGVPAYLPGRDVVAVGFVEVDVLPDSPAAVRMALEGEGAFDYVWFTSKAPRTDPCAMVPDGMGTRP